ncbi:MAG TPA: tetratricopeptide repeat protein, partial [Spirochaetota bacterium]
MKDVIRVSAAVCIICLSIVSLSAADKSARTLGILPDQGRGNLSSGINSDIEAGLKETAKDAISVLPASVILSHNVSSDDIRDSEKLRKISIDTGARWFLYTIASESDTKYSATILMYGLSQNAPLVLSYENIPSYDELRSRIRADIPLIVLKISSGDGYSLHRDPSLRAVTEFTDFGYSDDVVTFAYPFAVVSHDDTLLCASSSTVVRFDYRGKILAQYGKRGEGRGEYLSAFRVSEDAKKNVVLLDTGGKVMRFTPEGTTEFRCGQLTAIAVSPKGNIFVVEAGGRKLRIYSPTGEIIAEHATDNETPIALSRGRTNVIGLVVANNNYVVREYSETGVVVDHRLLLRQENGYFVSVKEDSRGNYFLLDMLEKKLVICAPDGSVRSVTTNFPVYPDSIIGTAADLAVSADGQSIFIADTTGKRIIKLKRFEHFPEYASAADNIAEAQKVQTSDPDRALVLLNAALKIDRVSRPALALLAELHEKEGRLDRALMFLQALLDIDPANTAYKKNFSRVDATRELSRADRFAGYARDRLTKFGPETAKFSYDEAVKGYERTLKLDPAFPGARDRYDALRKLFGTKSDDALSLTIEKTELIELFSAMYKYYADNTVGTITIINSTGKTIDRLTAETEVKNFMDYPTESRPVRSIKPGEKVRIQLFALFNNRILSLTEDTPVAFKIKIRYTVEGKDLETVTAGNATVYNRNALTWEPPAKLASFITPRDSTVKMCARTVVQIFRNSRFP